MLTPDGKAKRARTNKRIIGVFAALFVLLAIIGLTTGKNSSPEKAIVPADPAGHYTPAEARAELARLLKELDSFKNLSGFHDAGFGDKAIPQAARWHADAMALRSDVSARMELPSTLRAATLELLNLGNAYWRSKGQMIDDTVVARSAVEDGLKP